MERDKNHLPYAEGLLYKKERRLAVLQGTRFPNTVSILDRKVPAKYSHDSSELTFFSSSSLKIVWQQIFAL